MLIFEDNSSEITSIKLIKDWKIIQCWTHQLCSPAFFIHYDPSCIFVKNGNKVDTNKMTSLPISRFGEQL